MKVIGLLVLLVFATIASATPRQEHDDEVLRHQRSMMRKSSKGSKDTASSSNSSSDEEPGFLCNTFDAECGMTAAEAQLAYLSTYEQLEAKLAEIAADSDIHIQSGPLVQNGGNDGLIDIDVPLSETCNPDYVNCDVCGDTNPTLREAMVCTVTNDPLGFPTRGNTDPVKIGKSTKGRDLLAVRIGTGATRVLVLTQQHGNEAASTEACLNFLQDITSKTGGRNKYKSLLKKLDILFILRANPDGGDPAGDNLSENYPSYLAPGAQYLDDKYFFRQNVDPRAGGAFGAVDGNPNSEPGFSGIVGRGYDLNRYNFFSLEEAIRPVENQAIVAAITAFQPRYSIDLHGDGAKSACTLDPTTIELGAAFGFLPIAECATDPPIPTLATSREDMVLASIGAGGVRDALMGATTEQDELISRAIGSTLWNAIGKDATEGHVIRFSQTQTGVASFNNGVFSRALKIALPVVSILLEVRNYGVAVKPVILGFAIDENGEPVPDIGIGLPDIEPCFLPDNICLHQAFVEEYLFAVVATLEESDDDELAKASDSFCTDVRVENSNVGTAPSALGWPAAIARDDLFQVPGGGQFGVPTVIAGNCPGD